MEAADKRSWAGGGNDFRRVAYGHAAVRDVFCFDGSYPYNRVRADIDPANQFRVVAQRYPISDNRIFKPDDLSLTVSFMIKAQQYTNRDVAIAADCWIGIDDYGAVMADTQSRADIGLPWNLESIFDRIVSQGYSTNEI